MHYFPQEAAEGSLATLTDALTPPRILEAVTELFPSRLGEFAPIAENVGRQGLESFAKAWTANNPKAAVV